MLKKNLMLVVLSNLVVIASSSMNNFFIPTHLSVDEFANYKTYFLLSSFIGFLHFGYVDGINVSYGGVEKEKVNKKVFTHQYLFFIIFQIIITLCVFVTAVILNNTFIYLISLAIIPTNINSFFLFFYQAIGEFKLYARFTIIAPIANIIFLPVLVFFNFFNFEVFVLLNIFCQIATMIYIQILFSKRGNKIKNISLLKTGDKKVIASILKGNFKFFKSGLFIMLGTILFNLFFDIGKWTSKLFTSNEGFAIYSIAISIIGMILIFVSALNKTFYPYLHKNYSTDNILKLRKSLYCVSTLVLPFFFIMKYFIMKYLENYSDSLSIAAILLTSIPGIFIIKSLYANFYKVEKKEYLFFKDTVFYLIIGLFLSLASFYVFKSLNAIAFASVLTIYIWNFFPRTIVNMSIKVKIKEAFYLFLVMSLFYVIYVYDKNFVLSFLISSLMIFLINIIYYKKTIFKIFKF